MGPQRYVTRGLVLRETDIRDTDKILTVLTAERGKLSVIARGARRKGSRVAAACQLLAYSELTLYEKGQWMMLDEANTLELFGGLRQDLEALSLAAYLAELTEAVSEGCGGEALPLLLNALYALSTLHKPTRLVKPAFQLRLMALAGYEPLAEGCARCGIPEPEEPMLDVVHGVVHCAACREKGGLSLPLDAAALSALRYALWAPARRLYSFTLPPASLTALNHAADAFVSAQLERSFRTLDYYKSILPQEDIYYD